MVTSLACNFDPNAAFEWVVDKQTHVPVEDRNTLLVPGNVPQLAAVYKLYSKGCSHSQIGQHCVDDSAYYATPDRAQMLRSKRKC